MKAQKVPPAPHGNQQDPIYEAEPHGKNKRKQT